MAAPLVYISFPGTAKEALGFYAGVFGGELSLDSYKDHGRTDGPPDAVAHGILDGVVSLAGSDTPEGEPPVRWEGLLLSLLQHRRTGSAARVVRQALRRRQGDRSPGATAMGRRGWPGHRPARAPVADRL